MRKKSIQIAKGTHLPQLSKNMKGWTIPFNSRQFQRGNTNNSLNPETQIGKSLKPKTQTGWSFNPKPI